MPKNTLSIHGAVKIPKKTETTKISFYEWENKNKKSIEIEYKEERDSENKIKEYFESQGYLAFNLDPSPNKENGIEMLPVKAKQKYRSHPLVRNSIVAGTPDILVLEPEQDEIFYVEVKKGADSLRKNQFEFMTKSDKKCFVAWVENVNKVTEHDYKCPRCKEVFDSDSDFKTHECNYDRSSSSSLASDDLNWDAWGYANPDN